MENKSKSYNFDKVFHPGSSQGAWRRSSFSGDFVSYSSLNKKQVESYFIFIWHDHALIVGNFQMKFLQKLNPSSNQSLMVTMPAFLHMGKPAQEKLSQW
jgi:hypothetical protein